MSRRATRSRAGRAPCRVAAVAAALVAAALGCARSLPPPGGPIDTIPPQVIATTPADSAVLVDRGASVELLFSEGMDRASVRDNIRVYPPVGLPSYDWSGRRFRIAWGDSLDAGTTYQVFLSGRARDLRGVGMGSPLSIRFSTGDSLAPGRITGVVRAKTLRVQGVPVLLVPAAAGVAPDTSRAMEPSYQTETDSMGVYAFSGLPLETAFDVFAFYDGNGDDYFDVEQDVLAGHGAAVRLTPGRALADSINIVAVNPRAPGALNGSIASPDSSARFRIEVRAAADSSLVTRIERDGPGTFVVRVPAGRYWLAARRLASAPRPPRPGVPAAPTVTEASTVHREVIAVAAEEERGPFVLTFPPAAAPPPPPEEESR